MSSELEGCLSRLKTCLETQQGPRARTVIERITKLLLEVPAEGRAEIEYNLELLFNDAAGLVAFLERSFAASKQFAKTNEDCFELFRKTIEKHSRLVSKWIERIVSVALRYIVSTSVTARERELATLVLQDSISYGCLDADSYPKLSTLVTELLPVFQQRKPPLRFQQNLFELLGQLSKAFPQFVSEPGRLLEVFVGSAESQLLEENNLSVVSLAGAVRGLDLFLHNFAPDAEQPEIRHRIYLLVKKLSPWEELRSERIVFRNALQLLANHAALFGDFLYTDHAYWQVALADKWIRSSNRDDRRIGLAALYAFHGEMASALLRRDNESPDATERRTAVDVLNRYLTYYRKLLNTGGAERLEVRIAIRGFGIMAGPCHRLTEASASVDELLTIVLERIECICAGSSTGAGDRLEDLPDFVQSLSEILTHVEELSTVQLRSLQTMIVALIRDFYHLGTVYHQLIVRSLACTLANIHKLGGSSLDLLLDNVLLQGIIWSCSHKLPYGPPNGRSDTAQDFDWKRETVTYKNYLPLWKGLLGKNSDSNEQLVRSIFRSFMRTLFVIIEKLDLSTKKRVLSNDNESELTKEMYFCDPNLNLEPVKPKDFHIFLNLIELYRDVLQGSQHLDESFLEWTCRYFEMCVKQSVDHPLVSGFVKLIELGVAIAERSGYFRQANDFDSKSTALLLVAYVERTIVRALHASGELQLACLRFVLNVPARMLVEFVDDEQHQQPLMIAVFEVAFRLGRTLLSIARAALGCLQRLVLFRDPPIHAAQREQLLRQVLPLLEPYLLARESTLPPLASRRLVRFHRDRTANMSSEKIERIKLQHRTEQFADVSELVTLQLRIVNFLADLQPNECCWLLVEKEHEEEPGRPIGRFEVDQSTQGTVSGSLLRWNAQSERSIELRLLCASGIRPCIKLDGLIGRVAQLALGSSDRATKLAACEILHTLILYLLGIHYQDEITGLWCELCDYLLQLSCDTDVAVCQMFEPLLFQIVHYLTQPSKMNQKGTLVLLECLLNATAHRQHSAVRDLAVRALREFLQWANRQSGGTASFEDRRRIKCTLLDGLRTYAMESNAARRYGAALAFNNLFRLLLQEDYHLVRYLVDLLAAFAAGFVLTEDLAGLAGVGQLSVSADGDALEQFSLALAHLGKVLSTRRALFDAAASCESIHPEYRQIIPPAIGGGRLKDVVRWLFRQCAHRQHRYRRECRKLFLRLAASVEGVASAADFLQQHIPTSELESVCLHADVSQGIAQASTLDSLRSERAVPLVANVYLWMEYLHATFDMCCWLLKEKLLAPDTAERLVLARLLPVVRYCLQSVVMLSLHGLILLIDPQGNMETVSDSFELRMNADKIVRFDTLRAGLVGQIVELLVVLLNVQDLNAVPSAIELWEDESTNEFLLTLVFESQQFGLDCSVPVNPEQSVDQNGSLWNHLGTIIEGLFQHDSQRIRDKFTSTLTQRMIRVIEEVGKRITTLLAQQTVNELDQKSAKGLLFLAKLHRNRVVEDPRDRGRFQDIARKLLNDCFEAVGRDGVQLILSPSAARFGTILLQAVYRLSSGSDTELLQRTIVCCLTDTMLRPAIPYGQHFVACFGAAIFEMILVNPIKSLPRVLSSLSKDSFASIVQLLCELMEYAYRKHSADKDLLRQLTETLLGQGWNLLLECSRTQENRFGAADQQLIALLANVAMICPFALWEIRTKVDSSYAQWLISLIADQSRQIALKTKAIVLLPTILGPEEYDEVQHKMIKVALEKLQDTNIPLRSTEFPPDSPERLGFVNCLERLLDALVVSRSPLLLKSIVQMTAPDGKGHIAERQIRNAIERFFKNQCFEVQCARLQDLWALYVDNVYAPAVRVTILHRYLRTGLWCCSYDTIVEFYRRNIRAIAMLVEVELVSRSGWELEHALVDRTGGFYLVEQYAALLPRSMLLREDCSVARELYLPLDGSVVTVRGNRLIGDFSKRAHTARRLPFRAGDDRTVAERFRQYQCAAYRALVALISNTNDDPRMYSILLFRENREKREYLWRNLVDCRDETLYLEASQQLEEMPRIIEKRIAIRREMDSRSRPLDPGSHRSVVAESSLSQEVSRYDLNHSVVLSARELAQRDAAELALRQRGSQSAVPLERTRINEHEVMATVCGCLQHMAQAKITIEPLVRFIADSLNDPDQPPNVRLFLAKLIDNCRAELKPHASLLIAPIMQLIVDERVFYRGLNTLVTDLIALVLEWSGPAEGVRVEGASSSSSAEMTQLASALLRFIMKHCCQQRAQREVFRLNLELTRAVIRQWHQVLIVPTELLYGMIAKNLADGSTQQDDRVSFELITGLQLGTIVLLNGAGMLTPWTESSQLTYVRSVMQSLSAPNSTIYRPAAQLLGLSMARLFPEGVPQDDVEQSRALSSDLISFYRDECIEMLSTMQRSQGRKFLEILSEASKAFPSIVDPFLTIVSFRLPMASVAEKRICLELLLGGRLERFGADLYRELASMGLGSLLREAELQLPTLHLLNRALPLITELEELVQLIDPVGKIITEPLASSPEVRAVAFEILIYIHETRAQELSNVRCKDIWKLLIRGLADVEPPTAAGSSIPVRILEYLTASGRLPSDVRERFHYLLAELYDPSVETDFLGCAVALLFDPAIRCRESKERLFLHEYLAADVKFREYTIETGPKRQHSSTLSTPLFTESILQRSQLYTGTGSRMEAIIRATQFAGSGDYTDKQQFEPTQDPVRYTQGQDTFALPTQHSLLFEASSLQLDRRSRRKDGAGQPEQQAAFQTEQTFERLRKRILRDSETSRRQYVTRAIDRQHTAQRQRRAAGAQSVSLYRRYRLADYPDLQINLLAFLLPLQALCRRDATCARQTFVAIFNGLAEGLRPQEGGSATREDEERERRRFLEQLDSSIQRILESSKVCDPNLFGALMELTLGSITSGRMTLGPRTVATVAGSSNMLTMGVLYLEGKLTDGDEFDEEPMRSVAFGERSQAAHWLQLSILYHALQEHDVVASIFGEKWDSDPRLRKAIELEALGRYDRAYRAYLDLISSAVTASVRVEERNFCYKSACECLVRLAQWDSLLLLVSDQVTTYEELWSDDWNQEHLLPGYMHASVRQNLAGDERGREFCQLLQQWMHVPERASYIRQQFGEELSALQIACGEMVRARLYADQTQRQFLDEWHCAGVLSEVYRTHCLLEVRKVSELRGYSVLLELPLDQLVAEMASLAVAWRYAMPSATDSLIVWDTLVAYRRFLLEQLERKLSGSAEEPVMGSSNLSKLTELLVELELRLLEVATVQNNIKYAGRVNARLQADKANLASRRGTIGKEYLLRRRIARAQYDRLRLSESSSSSAGRQMIKCFGQLSELTKQEDQSTEARVPRALGAAWKELYNYARYFHETSTEEALCLEESNSILTILKSFGEESNDISADRPLADALHHFSLSCLKSNINEMVAGRPSLFGNQAEVERATSADELADAYLSMAQFCYESLDTTKAEAEQRLLERELITSLLSAMQYGSGEARQLFPVLLQLRNLHNDALREEFIQQTSMVPTWLFLPWIPQILSYLPVTVTGAVTGGSFLDELVERLVREYPMALYFPLRLSLASGNATAFRPFIARIRSTLQFPVMDRFVEELYRVVVPEKRFLTVIAKLREQLRTVTDANEHRRIVENALVTSDGLRLFPTDDGDHRFGSAYLQLLPHIRQLATLADLHPVDERDQILVRMTQLEEALRTQRSQPLRLEDLSPWLADYHFSGNQQDQIELPAQYGRDERVPSATNHGVRIVKIVPEVQVFGATLRAPVLLTFRGSDGRAHRFLAKSGEDLRQDQRIQQLQQEITHRLRYDRCCREQRLELRSYQVIPIRRDYGLIGWLEDTVSIKDIAKQATPRYNPNDRGANYVVEEYGRFLLQISRLGTSEEPITSSLLKSSDLYGRVAAYGDPQRLRLKYIELKQTIRLDTLKRVLFDMAVSPEAFYRLRMNFGRSLATMNVTCWVLGIGDRHLSNIVLERATGKLAGVDFGLAFGAGTRDLPVPELVPFRLTPQFMGVMEPLRLSGILHKCHLYTLQCLRDARKLLRACLEVFIREPTLDWLEVAKQRTAVREAGDGAAGTAGGRFQAWNPQTRVDFVMQKLNGANPKRLLMDELRQGVVARQREHLVGYLAIVQSAAEQVQAALKGNELTLPTELQVAMLLELAIDEKLLGITYGGWYPWF
ncbi:DNA-dependent protein kinase catalytic subunit-like [Anopheles albimanus]|uniref:non-specific serine/threonine protein kinase n=1 Tax=Anopheles albimanus TaxID=7167 RepID=A0A182FL54_ANOAL|nr:DNA-dependent protein kinase catalytic subunit-like [Anopheles albimanus]